MVEYKNAKLQQKIGNEQSLKRFFAIFTSVESFAGVISSFIKNSFAILEFMTTFVKNHMLNIPGIFVGEGL